MCRPTCGCCRISFCRRCNSSAKNASAPAGAGTTTRRRPRWSASRPARRPTPRRWWRSCASGTGRSVRARGAHCPQARAGLCPRESSARAGALDGGGRGDTQKDRAGLRGPVAQRPLPVGNTKYGATKRRPVTLTYGSTRGRRLIGRLRIGRRRVLRRGDDRPQRRHRRPCPPRCAGGGSRRRDIAAPRRQMSGWRRVAENASGRRSQ